MGQTANVHVEPMIFLQKKAVRIISKTSYFEHTEPLFFNLKLLSVDDIYKFSCIKFIYQCYNSNTYTYFRKRLRKNSEFHRYETSSGDLLRLPNGRFKRFKNSFMENGIRLWNKLPSKTKTAPSIDVLKSQTKDLIFKKSL